MPPNEQGILQPLSCFVWIEADRIRHLEGWDLAGRHLVDLLLGNSQEPGQVSHSQSFLFFSYDVH